MESWVSALGISLMMLQFVHGFSTSFSGAPGTQLSSPCLCSGFRAPCISQFSSPWRWGSTGWPALVETRRSKVCHFFMQSDGVSKAPKVRNVKGLGPIFDAFLTICGMMICRSRVLSHHWNKFTHAVKRRTSLMRLGGKRWVRRFTGGGFLNPNPKP